MRIQKISLKVAALSSAAAVLAVAMPAAAQVVTFDDVGPHNSEVLDGHAGLDWDNIFVRDTVEDPNSGYAAGLISGQFVGFNGFANLATISSNNPFSFTSGHFTAAWNDGLTVTVKGFVANVETFSSIFTVDTLGPTFQTFNWNNLSSVTIIGEGGVENPDLVGSGEHVAFDNLIFGVPNAVPEPATWAMLIFGFGMIGSSLRRRKTTVSVRYA